MSNEKGFRVHTFWPLPLAILAIVVVALIPVGFAPGDITLFATAAVIAFGSRTTAA
ncbi:hypothetical protein BDW60DRAFT_198469 [Aspergillus nidulans var. acristatus]|jgi:hypothetical protein